MSYDIGIDARMLHNTGIGTYLKGILDHFQREPLLSSKKMGLFGIHESRHLYHEITHEPFDAPIYSFKEQLEYPKRLSDCKLWHAPHYNVPFKKGKTRLVVTIHDLIHWLFRKDFFNPIQGLYAKTMFSTAVRTADHIIAVSQRTKDDLVRHFHANPVKITVIYEGTSPIFRPLENPQKVASILIKYRIPDSYFLYVGLIKPHKNIHRLVEVFTALYRTGKVKSSLVLVGKMDPKYKAACEILARCKPADGIIYLPYIETDELVGLYNGAQSLVHPSLYEGFGLTLLEAMNCGSPVIAYDAGSIPEVAGEAGLLVPTGDEKKLAEAIERVEQDDSLRNEMRQRGFEQSKRFHWAETAHKTAEIYLKVLNS